MEEELLSTVAKMLRVGCLGPRGGLCGVVAAEMGVRGVLLGSSGECMCLWVPRAVLQGARNAHSREKRTHAQLSAEA
jgi:hypothetical protein